MQTSNYITTSWVCSVIRPASARTEPTSSVGVGGRD